MSLAPIARTRCLTITYGAFAYHSPVTIARVYGFRPQTLLIQEVNQIKHQVLETPQSLIWNVLVSLSPCNRNLGDTFDDWAKPWSKFTTPIILAVVVAFFDLTSRGNLVIILHVRFRALWYR
jgi:hypothetical protein